MNRLAAVLAALAASSPVAARAATLHVPGDHATIQAAIAAASAGDTVLVSPGTYAENLGFAGKAITVASTDGAAVTIVDGGGAGPVVRFAAGEGPGSVLSGFTLRNGFADEGGGVQISYASPTIVGNRIEANRGCAGAGVGIGFGSPVLQGNTISGNSQAGCSGGIGGGGVSVRGFCTAKILDNFIGGNATSSDGGGVTLFASGLPALRGNVLAGNTAARGGAIAMYNGSDVDLVGNVIVGNRATSGEGGGIYWLLPTSSPRVIGNTIAGNDAAHGAGLYADGYDGGALVANNVIVAGAGQSAVYCGDFNDLEPPILRANDVWAAPGGLAYDGICGAPTGTAGNLSVDPGFVSAAGGDFRPSAGSPLIDAGTADVPVVPALDVRGATRVVDGDADGVSTIDLGAYERQVIELDPSPIPTGGPWPDPVPVPTPTPTPTPDPAPLPTDAPPSGPPEPTPRPGSPRGGWLGAGTSGGGCGTGGAGALALLGVVLAARPRGARAERYR
jgi:nitrous oxidase accessory protein NosD